MQNTKSLTCLYADYDAKRLEKKKFEGIIFEAILKRIPRAPGFGKEDFEDFVSWLYPRISRAIDSYRDTGASFGAYISKLVSLSAHEYRVRDMRSYNAEVAAWVSQASDMYACEREPGYLEYSGGYAAQVDAGFDEEPEQSEQLKLLEGLEDPKNSRQLLILILKCCRYVSEDFLEKIAPRLGMDPVALGEMIDCLKESREKREANKEALRELANYQFCRYIFYEGALQLAKDKPIVAERIRKRLEYYRVRLDNTRRRIAKMHLNPSNAQVAEILGLSKGTVDAVLHSLKARHIPEWRDGGSSGYDSAILN